MEDKLNYYDVVAHLVPGSLVLGVLVLIPQALSLPMPRVSNDALALVAAVPTAYAAGQVVQAVSSFAQPIYYHLWGGMPSDYILAGKSDRISAARLSRIIAELRRYFRVSDGTPAGLADLFADAMALCNKEGLGRVESFNAAYALHRALLTAGITAAVLLAVASLGSILLHGLAASAGLLYLLILSAALAGVEFMRARQRGEYFAVEVLSMAYLEATHSAPADGSTEAAT